MSKRGSYKLLECIGEGAYGKAYLAVDSEGKKVVAKVVDVAKVPQSERLACITEVKLLATLNHPFIVRYIDSYIEGQNLHIVMNFCDGGDLAGLIRHYEQRNERIPEKQMVKWLTQLLMAVKYTHANRIIHRDIKSQNIFIEKGERLRLADFGISRALESTHAMAKTFIGTPYYLSPELCEGSPYGPPSDMWAVGCVAYEMASYRTPFHAARNLPDLCFRICNAKISPLSSFYSAELRDIIYQMLDKRPKTRATAADILETPMMQVRNAVYVQREIALFLQSAIRFSSFKSLSVA
ncbi:hypothetical protein Efla_002264 [Eimeria flavescens]